jgi:hypothetical protein
VDLVDEAVERLAELRQFVVTARRQAPGSLLIDEPGECFRQAAEPTNGCRAKARNIL